MTHTQKLKSRINGNPQGCDDDDIPPQTFNNRGYYGKPPLEPTISNTKSFVNAVTAHTPATPTTTHISNEANDKLSELENIVNNMKTAQEKTQHDLAATKTSIDNLSQTVNDRIDQVEKQGKETMKEFIAAQTKVNSEKALIDQQREEDFKKLIMTTLSNKETPSGVEQSSARGGDQ